MFIPIKYHEHIAANYLNVWNGDLTLLNATFSPGVTLYIDRFPSQTGEGSEPVEVGTSEEFCDFVEQSRSGWEQYRFEGEPVTYNGTDFLILNECTGLADEADIAGDSLTLFHNLGLTSVTV
ncbi:hypothetical protein QBC33DRAFT_623268 [Phialemonium atrogriseum]|uniref:Uncharacterized protein n=1 Tax=Phialemonium atrogriseum TaxID=1093897 RepID=A0AAJ0BRC1_9PEZI|nr:uncharacterized protein QBC33DRAFT_623268 [Phialemonium atrogriseum]KAK1763058.1 hypothetical protein QBC33DRAFT_623268 [Phialemonium atrogriseum]